MHRFKVETMQTSDRVEFVDQRREVDGDPPARRRVGGRHREPHVEDVVAVTSHHRLGHQRDLALRPCRQDPAPVTGGQPHLVAPRGHHRFAPLPRSRSAARLTMRPSNQRPSKTDPILPQEVPETALDRKRGGNLRFVNSGSFRNERNAAFVPNWPPERPKACRASPKQCFQGLQ